MWCFKKDCDCDYEKTVGKPYEIPDIIYLLEGLKSRIPGHIVYNHDNIQIPDSH